MFKKELLLPLLLGLGVYAQSSEVNLCNNTTILLILFMLLKDEEKADYGLYQFGCRDDYRGFYRGRDSQCRSCCCDNCAPMGRYFC